MGTWNYVVNDKFVEQYGEGAGATFLRVIEGVAGRVRPGDRDGAADLLKRGLGEAGMDFPAKSVDQLAENMTLAEHDRMVISTDDGHILGEIGLPGSAGPTSEERRNHEAGDDPERPLYS